ASHRRKPEMQPSQWNKELRTIHTGQSAAARVIEARAQQLKAEAPGLPIDAIRMEVTRGADASTAALWIIDQWQKLAAQETTNALSGRCTEKGARRKDRQEKEAPNSSRARRGPRSTVRRVERKAGSSSRSFQHQRAETSRRHPRCAREGSSA